MPDQNSNEINSTFQGIQQVPYHIHNGIDAPQLPFSSISTYSVSTDGTMAADSQTLLPTQSAVVTYVAAHIGPGGSGIDGALNISSGTTTINCGALPVVVKNYTSITISGTAKLAFSNPNAGGTVIIFLSQGNISITSSNNPAVDLTSMGGSGGVGGNISTNGTSASPYPAILDNNAIHAGLFGHGASGVSAGVGAGTTTSWNVLYRGRLTGPGMGGGGGGGGSTGTNSLGGVGGNGGIGGGTLILESGGNITITGMITLAGGNGTNGQNTGDGVNNAFQGGGGGGGGGGASGSFIATYVGSYSNSGTVVLTAGSGEAGGAINVGSNGSSGVSGAGGGGGGGGASVTNGGLAGNTGGTGGGVGNFGGTGGNGGIGAIYVNQLV